MTPEFPFHWLFEPLLWLQLFAAFVCVGSIGGWSWLSILACRGAVSGARWFPWLVCMTLLALSAYGSALAFVMWSL
jgi:hypothetical protein